MTTDLQMERFIVEADECRQHQYFGKYRGIVKEVGTQDKLGYLKAQVPAVYGQEVLSPWALPSVPFAGDRHGFVVLPEAEDGVWIEFEAGNINHPIWTGCWWSRGEIPEPGGPQTRVLATSGGHKLILDDDQNTFQLLHAGGAEITMTENDITFKIGSTQIVLSASGVDINNGAFKVI